MVFLNASLYFKFANGFMCLIYLLCALVQYNDPDVLLWLALYGLAASLCALAVFDKAYPRVSFVFGGACLIWSIVLIPSFAGSVSVAELFQDIRMKTSAVEAAREAGGLAVVTLWMFVLFYMGRAKVKIAS